MGRSTDSVTTDTPDEAHASIKQTATTTDIKTGKKWERPVATSNPDGSFDTTGGGGDDGGMDHEHRITELERVVPTLATKADVALLPTKTEFAELRADFAKFQATVADIRADIHKSITETSRWTHTALVGIFSVFVLGVVGLMFTIYNATKAPAPKQEAPAPVIITVPVPQVLPAPLASPPPPKK